MMKRKEILEITQKEHNKYIEKKQSAIDAWEKEENINTFEVYLKNAIEKEIVLWEWYIQL